MAKQKAEDSLFLMEIRGVLRDVKDQEMRDKIELVTLLYMEHLRLSGKPGEFDEVFLSLCHMFEKPKKNWFRRLF